MPSISRSADVAASPAAAFDYLKAGEHVREWLPDLSRSERLTPGPIRPGSRFVYAFRALGRDFEVVNELTAVEPFGLLRFRAISGVPNHGHFEIASLDGGRRSLVTLWFEFQFPGGPFGAIARRLPVAAIMDHYAQLALRNLVRRLESLESESATESA